MGKGKKGEQELAAQIAELGDVVGHGDAEAIAAYVEYRIDARLGVLRKELEALVANQDENVEVAKTDGSPKAAKAANKATEAVKEADKAVKEAEADPTPEKVAVAEAKKGKAQKTVSETRSELVALTEMVERHEIILAPRQRGETKGNRPKSRFDNIEDELVGMRADMDQTAAASADALAIARSIQGGPSLWAVAIVTFVVAFVIMVVAAIFSPLTIFWDAVLVAFGTTVFVTVAAAILDHLMPSASESIAQARAKAQARRGQENDDVVPGLAEHTPPPKMSAAEAEASARVAARR